jgi:ligand-binding sensor domain-containing protein/serine phosphatase RsbU (regulator of sigma subunit)
MKFKTKLSYFTIFVLLAGNVFFSHAQVYKFLKYGPEKGISHPFVYSINQDKNGFLWASTGLGLCRYDGFDFVAGNKLVTGKSDSLTEAYAAVSFKDKNGNLWFGHSNGIITYYDGRKFEIIHPKEASTSSINGIIQDKDGNILAISQSNGLIKINAKKKTEVLTKGFEGRLFYCLNITSDNELLLGNDDGIAIYSYENGFKDIKEKGKVDGLPLSKVQTIYQDIQKDEFLVGTEDAGFYKIYKDSRGKKFKVENLGKLINIENENVQSLLKDNEGNLWVSTFKKGLFKIIIVGNTFKDIIHYDAGNGLGINDIKSVYQDREGNVWVATYGNGMAAMVDESFTFFNYRSKIGRDILSVAFHPDGYWLGGEKGLLKVTNGLKKDLQFISGLPSDAVTSLYYSDNGSLWIGTDKNGVYLLLPGQTSASSFFKTDNSLGNSVNSITELGNDLYIGTKNGIYQVNYLNKSQKHYSTSEGLPYNNIRQVFADSKGNIWVATRSNSLFTLNGELKMKLDGNVEIEFTSIAEDKDGNIWAGTNGTGVFKFTNKELKYYSLKTGLKSDFCYAMIADKSGNIWVGHRAGLSRINIKNNLIKIYGPEAGIDGDINNNAFALNSNGNLLFGTTSGLIHYESSKVNTHKLAPIVNITSVIISDKEYDCSKRIELPYSAYKMRIEFIGLNYSNPEQVTYKYKLEGFDLDWSEASTARFAIYSRLTDGNYTFWVKSCNSDGQWNEEPIALEISINKPFWKTWWFMSLVVIALVVGVYMIIVIRERKQKEFQVYLEKLLDERTKEVREQKEEIETKNRDITDSINYAQRIQASILPSVRKLQQYFTGSFVYYAPRDIVSGDFYWFDQLPGTNKFIIVCADSTGHGVPGAFMSMIGTTLIKDICNRPDVLSPSDILNVLDNEIKSTLNQSLEGERPNDGMDIIVCELDVKRLIMRCASAMRPFIVYKNGEQLYFKGSRNSIGGQVREEKIFETEELQLTKGDLIYMFSDGYPDQFGGPLGKKFKMVRLKNLLKDIYEKPMEEQYNYVKSNFELWRGELAQVDDVLFMGIRI